MDDVLKLKELLDVDTFAPVAKQLQQKAWLMHWSLFVFFNHENGLNALIDLFMQDRCDGVVGHSAARAPQCGLLQACGAMMHGTVGGEVAKSRDVTGRSSSRRRSGPCRTAAPPHHIILTCG